MHLKRSAELRRLLADEQAVTPVIGVILMVSIAVIMASVVGTFVLGVSGQTVAADAPQVSFAFEYDADTSVVIVTHLSGSAVDASDLSAKSDDPIGALSFADAEVNAGDAGTVTGVDAGETVRIVWTKATGDGASSSTVAKYTAPE